MPVKGLKTTRPPWALAAAALTGLSMLAGCAGAPETRGLGPGTVTGYVVADAETGRILAEQNPDRPFIPASTAKLPTMVAALELLGPDYRFHTDILAAGKPDHDGVLSGDLILRGGGDPLLSPQDLMGLAGRLKDLGLKRVTGRFIHDDSLLPPAAAINPDQPAEARYNTGVSALSVDFNRWRLIWRRDAETGRFELIPLPPDTARRVDQSKGPHGPGRNILWREGGWRLGADAADAGDVFLPARDPARATADLFRRIAGDIGITLPPAEAGRTPEGAPVVTRLKGLPLAEIARQGLEHSNNLVAELVGLTTHRLARGRPATLAQSAAGLSDWLIRTVKSTAVDNTDWSSWRMLNHSGLSRLSRVSPRQMAAVLKFAHSRRYGAWPITGFLPAAGFRRAFRDRFLTGAAAARIWAKTGTMHYAKGLAGYLTGPDGRTSVFALYIADPGQRQSYDALTPERRDDPAEQDRALDWIDAAEQREQEILLRWLTQFGP